MGAALVHDFVHSIANSLRTPQSAELRAEDLRFVAALQAGSEEAFAQLIAQYSGPLYSVIARSLPNPADAADILQEVFIKIFRNIGSFHGESSLRTWVYRIALHESSNSRRASWLMKRSLPSAWCTTTPTSMWLRMSPNWRRCSSSAALK